MKFFQTKNVQYVEKVMKIFDDLLNMKTIRSDGDIFPLQYALVTSHGVSKSIDTDFSELLLNDRKISDLDYVYSIDFTNLPQYFSILKLGQFLAFYYHNADYDLDSFECLVSYSHVKTAKFVANSEYGTIKQAHSIHEALKLDCGYLDNFVHFNDSAYLLYKKVYIDDKEAIIHLDRIRNQKFTIKTIYQNEE